MTVTTPDLGRGEARATRDNIEAYLLANYRVRPATVEATLDLPWVLQEMREGLHGGGLAFWVGDRIARRLGWAWREEGR